MRKIINHQMKLGSTDVSKIKLNIKCRDEVPRILQGIKHIYTDDKTRNAVFKILEKLVPKDVISWNNGRQGMELWNILVLGVIRLGANIDYDRLHDWANNHGKIREFLGHGDLDQEEYSLQSIRDNVRLFTPEILDEINTVVIASGHDLIKKKSKDPQKELDLHGRCDSFVVETDVHYPTDLNLLFDAMRKIITFFINIKSDISGWRQAESWIQKLKNAKREIEKLKHSIRGMEKRYSKIPKNKKDKKKKAKEKIDAKKNGIKKLHREYINMAGDLIEKAEGSSAGIIKTITLDYFIGHAKHQIDLIKRRVLNGEVIPHSEKVFSIFEPHTEWISKGKAGVPQELGVKVSIVEDQYQFILHHEVMFKTEDKEIAVPIVEKTKEKFPSLKSCSFDKGYHSPQNQIDLKEILDEVILPKKGRPAPIEKEASFKQKRNQHAAVESAVNCLEYHGLDKCRDHGKEGFKRYVAVAVLSRNIDRLGSIVRNGIIASNQAKIAS